jgi:hypothetical protein
MKKLFKWLFTDQSLHFKLQCRYNEGYAKGHSEGKSTISGLRVRVTVLEARMERLDKLVFELRTRGAGKNDST